MLPKLVLVVITVLTVFTQCRFESALSLFPFNGTINLWDSSGSNMIVHSLSQVNTIQFYDFNTQYLNNITSPVIIATTNSISTHWLNTNTSFCFMIMNSNLTSSTFISVAFNSTQSNNLALVGANYTSWGFGPSVNQFYKTSYTLSNPLLQWYRGVSQQYSYTYTTNYQPLQQVFDQNTIFYAFLNIATRTSCDLAIFSTKFAGQPTYYNHQVYANCPDMKLDAYAAILLVNCGTFVQVRQSGNPYSVIGNFVPVSPVQQALYLNGSNSMIVKTSSGTLQQYDMNNFTLLDSAPISITPPHDMVRVADSIVYVFNSTHGTLYNISNLPNSASSNMNNMGNMNATASGSIDANLVYQYDKQAVRKITNALGNSMAITSIRFIFQSNVPLALFFEQFWLYKYYIAFQYPQIMKIFMQEVEIINIIRQNVSFLNFNTSSISFGSTSRFSFLYTSSQLSYSPFYFAQAIKEYCLISAPVTIALFLFLKIVSIGVKHLKSQAPCLVKFVLSVLFQKVQWWSLMLGLAQSNFLALCYYCLNQMVLCYSFIPDNKVVLIATILLLFLFTLYSAVCYPLLRHFVGKKFYTILVFSKEEKLFSYWLENWLIVTVRFIKCFAHSLTISETKDKFFFLILCDVTILLIFIYCRRLFLNLFHFGVYLIYQIGILTVNILLILLATSNYQFSNKFEWAFLYAFLILLGLTVIKFLLSIAKIISELCRMNKNNKIKLIGLKIKNNEIANLHTQQQKQAKSQKLKNMAISEIRANQVKRTTPNVRGFAKWRAQGKSKFANQFRLLQVQKTTLAVQSIRSKR